MKKTNLKKRIIPVILIKDYQVVKSRCYKDYRIFGNLEQTINVFNVRDVDEILILDIEPSKKNEHVNVDILKILSRNSLMPITYGGGIHALEDIQSCLKYGCDKVVINTQAILEPDFIKRAAKEFGSQCITVSIDYKIDSKEFSLLSHAGANINGINLLDFIKKMEDFGAGELYITSVSSEGMMKGYELGLMKKIYEHVSVPIIINGGCGEPVHMQEAINNGAEGVCASSMFLYTEHGYKDVKSFLKINGIEIRI